MANGGEAARGGSLTAFDQLVDGARQDVVVDARFVPRLATQERIHRDAKVLASDVPERNIDGAEGAHDRRAAEMHRAIEVLPVVLDPQRILTDEVQRELLDHLF